MTNIYDLQVCNLKCQMILIFDIPVHSWYINIKLCLSNLNLLEFIVKEKFDVSLKKKVIINDNIVHCFRILVFIINYRYAYI